ncbi:hypothetical protein [Paenibacillus sp. MBLB4367]|uniref:hypothetical protein n=1 Tax=Paenibacillus sp. MBLB4367 TaxID=3384767 RepID=UPI003908091C
MNDSLTGQQRVSHETLAERLETVKPLEQNDLESYEIVKDRTTGEHYLLYHYIHIVVADGGHKETYYHLMPLETDDVLAVMFGDQGYKYPDQWSKPYLRNSSDNDSYVWFDPSYAEEYNQYENTGRKLQDMLRAFKEEGQFDESKVRELLRRMDEES